MKQYAYIILYCLVFGCKADQQKAVMVYRAYTLLIIQMNLVNGMIPYALNLYPSKEVMLTPLKKRPSLKRF